MNSPRPIRFDAVANPAILDQVIGLGDRNNKTLGFLPFAGFRTAANEERIAFATSDSEEVLGYCLFDLPRDLVRVVQVCISDAARGTGLARALVDAVSERYADRLGLVLKCRADWPADKMWPRLGFVAQSQVAGRSKERHPLTVWWRSHGHPDLFTLLDERKAASRSAAVDSNVFCDLHSARPRQGSNHTAALAPLIADAELNIVVLPTLEAEIYATKDVQERARFLGAKANYTRATDMYSQAIVEQLMSQVPKRILAKDASLSTDARLIAEAYANGIDLFITRDRSAIRYLAEPAASLGTEVLHPTEVATYLDVEEAGRNYQPVHLEETTFSIQRLDRALTSDETGLLLNKGGGERLTELHRRLADLASKATINVRRSVLFDGESLLRAAWAEEELDALHVPLLRIPVDRLQTTLAAQLSPILRSRAGELGRRVVRVTDPHIHPAVRSTLEGDGYYADDEGLAALTLPMIGSWSEVSAAAQAAAEENGADALLRLLELPEDPSPPQTVELERLWAPVKILGQGIANYIVPIKPPFAAQLLGFPASLLSRPDDLGLSREHVYYSARRGPLSPPARILWYVSGKNEPAVIATSDLVEVRVDTPARLHRLYSRLGVWDLPDVTSAASRGRAAAMRFTDTELFKRPVGLDRVRALAPDGRRLLLRSAQQLDDGWYERIYREGVQR